MARMQTQPDEGEAMEVTAGMPALLLAQEPAASHASPGGEPCHQNVAGKQTARVPSNAVAAQTLTNSWVGRKPDQSDSHTPVLVEGNGSVPSEGSEQSDIADKACQAHDVAAAVTRLRWAARNAVQRKVEAHLRRTLLSQAASDQTIARPVLQAVAAHRRDAECEVTAAQRAQNDHTQRMLTALRDQQDVFSPPVSLPQAEYGHGHTPLYGCFAWKDANRQARKDLEDFSQRAGMHMSQLVEQLRIARAQRHDANQALQLLLSQNLDAAGRRLEMWARMAELCEPLEALCSGDAVRMHLENLSLQTRVAELEERVEKQREVLTETENQWHGQVEALEQRDRISIQEDSHLRARALTAEKALGLALQRLRKLERAGSGETLKRSNDASQELLRLRQELRTSKATIAALSASLAFQRDARVPKVDSPLESVGVEVKYSEAVEEPQTPGLGDAEDGLEVNGKQTLEHRLMQLQEAMDVLSPEWKHEMAMRAGKNQNHECWRETTPVEFPLLLDALGSAVGKVPWTSASTTSCVAQVMTRTEPLTFQATMRILGTRNLAGIRLHLHEPFLTVSVDGQTVISQVVASCVQAESQPLPREYVFKATSASIVRVSVCDWAADSRVGVKGVVSLAVADAMPVDFEGEGGGGVGQAWQKDWFPLSDADGVRVQTVEGIAALQLLLVLDSPKRDRDLMSELKLQGRGNHFQIRDKAP